MSIVADMLHSAGKLSRENIILRVKTLKRKIEDTKLELQSILRNRYVEFFPQYVRLDKLISSADAATSEYEVLYTEIEEIKPRMNSSVTEFHNVVEDLKKAKALTEVVVRLAAMHQHLEECKSFLLQSQFLNAARELLKFENLLNEIDSENRKDIEIYSALTTESLITKHQMIYQLQKLLKQNMAISRSDEVKKGDFRVVISLKKNSGDKTTNILMPLKLLNHLQPVLNEFGKQFLVLVCETLLSSKTDLGISDQTDCVDLNISITNENSPAPSEVFQKLTEIFKFLHSELFRLPLLTDGENHTLMNELGCVLNEKLCSMIIEKCLKPAIPKNSQHLELFNKEVEHAQNFNNMLCEIGFFTNNENKLHEFILGIDTLPVNKMSRDFFSRARSLMKESLHQTINSGVEASPRPISSGTEPDLVDVTEMKGSLNKLLLAFPQCQISQSAKSFVELLHEILSEAKNVGGSHSTRLYHVARSMCDLYQYVTPTFHKNEIETIPLLTAVFHNNCMYIAHNLLMLGPQYECELQTGFSMTFVDLVTDIRKLGIEAFLAQMRNQRKQLLELLQDSQVFTMDDDTEDSLINKAEKPIRQCLCQLQFLKKVWSTVLAMEVYCKAIGTLLNSFMEKMVSTILSMEDITADTASQLDSVFALLLKESPDLIKVTSVDKGKSVHDYVRHWFKFQELQLVLSSSMKEIVDRWSSGKGPLATHFTADEVKHLIRALFQNTERRAASLAKIR